MVLAHCTNNVNLSTIPGTNERVMCRTDCFGSWDISHCANLTDLWSSHAVLVHCTAQAMYMHTKFQIIPTKLCSRPPPLLKAMPVVDNKTPSSFVRLHLTNMEIFIPWLYTSIAFVRLYSSTNNSYPNHLVAIMSEVMLTYTVTDALNFFPSKDV